MKKDRILRKILLILIILFPLIWWAVMYWIDQRILCFACISHNISGEIWFQLISSCLLAVPSIGICAYAVYQTGKYHDLDEERLRPEILMDSAEISMCMVNWNGFDDWSRSKDGGVGVRQQSAYEQYRQTYDKEKSNSNLGYLDFKADLILKGGESVSQITIQQIVIQIGDRQYLMKFADMAKLIWCQCGVGAYIYFDRCYKGGKEEYHIEWHPEYKGIVLAENERQNRKQSKRFVQLKRDEGNEHIQKEFWDDMYNAVVDPEYDITRRSMEWRISMNIEYGMNRTRRGKMLASAEWRIRWNGKDWKSVNDYMAKQYSKEGILSVG